ncbi:hypothetical protein NE237_002020 [Protea cynaroides]|uniref:Uncharacterized protein n=1 Tax=Protea cynaroides TaxID=273540 RepID=A0A9Q0KVA3_9MAGN|nr:hypothetical protein NE237_002020 [Protea cynaroides]
MNTFKCRDVETLQLLLDLGACLSKGTVEYGTTIDLIGLETAAWDNFTIIGKTYTFFSFFFFEQPAAAHEVLMPSISSSTCHEHKKTTNRTEEEEFPSGFSKLLSRRTATGNCIFFVVAVQKTLFEIGSDIFLVIRGDNRGIPAQLKSVSATIAIVSFAVASVEFELIEGITVKGTLRSLSWH